MKYISIAVVALTLMACSGPMTREEVVAAVKFCEEHEMRGVLYHDGWDWSKIVAVNCSPSN